MIEQLKDILNGDLPGWEGQKLMSSIGYESNRKAKPTSKKAAVLLLLFPDSGQLKLTFIRRPSNNPNDKHGGQISFPGGQVENEDRNLEHTALRETFEEIGVQEREITILGRLSDIYVFVSDFLVSAYVGYSHTRPEFILQESEVAALITFPLSKLFHQPLMSKDHKVRDIVLKDVPYYDLDGEFLWGATAMITSELLELIRRNKLQL